MKTLDDLIIELDQNKQLIDFPYYYRNKIWEYMKKNYKGTTIQVGNWGDFGYCAFVGKTGFFIPVTKETYDLIPLAV